MVRAPRFEPGSSAWQADVLDHCSGNFPETSGSQATSITRLRPQTDAQIANTLIKLQNDARSPRTIRHIEWSLRQLARHANLSKPEEVKAYIATMKTQYGKPTAPQTKNKLLFDYNHFCKYNGIQWTKPYYRITENTPLIPITADVQAIIANSSQNYATVFTLLIDTGASPEELYLTTQNHINLERNEIHITGVKGHGSKPYKLKPQTVEMLRTYLAKNPQEHPFPHAHSQSEAWRSYRTKTAKKLSKPSLNNIQLRNLRNYSGEQFYKRMPIRDPIELMRHFRHKKLETTMHYIRAIITDYEEDNSWTVRTAKTAEEAIKLAESGFTKFDEIDGLHLYRKRK